MWVGRTVGLLNADEQRSLYTLYTAQRVRLSARDGYTVDSVELLVVDGGIQHAQDRTAGA